MKKFSLLTEYSESELLLLIDQTVQKVVSQQLEKIIPLIANSPPVNTGKLLTRKEVKAILRISYPTLALLTKQNVLKAKLVGASYRYPHSEIIKYLNEITPAKKRLANINNI